MFFHVGREGEKTHPLTPEESKRGVTFFLGGLYLLFVMIGEITFPRNTISSEVFGSIRPIQGSNWADWFS